MRVSLLVSKLADSATLRFYARGDMKAFEIKGAEVNSILARNLAAGDKTDAGRTYVGPMTTGADSTIEIELPAEVAADGVDIAIPTVSHITLSIADAAVAAQTAYNSSTLPTDGLTCEIDVNCRTTLPAASNAVTWLLFKESGYDYICSGTLLNDNLNSSKPYVITANHCISSQTVASTLLSVWQYKSASCNATNGNYYLASTGSSTLLYTAYDTDSSLLLLAGTPPAGSLFAGWDASVAPLTSTPIHSIHHPKGDAQRYSYGAVIGYSTRSATNANSFYGSDITNGTILDVSLTSGLTEGGSSGSGLFKGAETNPQLIGQLFGGQLPSCSNATVHNVYGRFDKAYFAGMYAWLSAQPNPDSKPTRKMGDFNGDGKSDILWRDSVSGTVAIHIMNGTAIESSSSFQISNSWEIAAIGDFNGDGKSDILWREKNTGMVAIHLMNGGTIQSFATFPISNNWEIKNIGDFNGDGKSDILWREKSTGTVAIHLMNGTAIASFATFPISNQWEIRNIGDFNGDGKADILWREKTDGTVAIHLMNGTAIASFATFQISNSWEIQNIGDFNGDGKSDILWREKSTGTVAIHLMNGATISSYGTYIISNDWEIKGIGDVNGDGKADIIWRNKNSGLVAIHIMNGYTINASGAYSKFLRYSFENIGDFNADGNKDVLWRDKSSGDINIDLLSGLSVIGNGGYMISPSWTIF